MSVNMFFPSRIFTKNIQKKSDHGAVLAHERHLIFFATPTDVGNLISQPQIHICTTAITEN